MTNWNPSPTSLGLEWRPDESGLEVINNLGRGVRSRITSTVAETVTGIVTNTPFGSAANQAVIACDIYPAGQVNVRTGLQTFQYLPNGDGAVTSWVSNPGGSGSNLWQNIDEDPAAANLNDSIIEPSRIVGRSARFYVGSGGYSSSKRIVSVTVRMRIFGGSVRCSLHHLPTDTRSVTLVTGYNANGSSSRIVDLNFGEICPWTGLPWRAADIVAFDTDAVIAIARDDTSGGFLVPQIYAMALRVRTWDEQRVAYGVATPGSAALTTYPIRKVSDGSIGWAKPSSGDFDYQFRAVRGGPFQSPAPMARFGWVAGELPDGSGLGGTTVSVIDADGLSVIELPAGHTPDRVLAVVQQVAGGFSVDGSQYGAHQEFTPAMRQILLSPSAASYGAVSLIVRPPADVNTDQTITVQASRLSDSAAVGSPVTISRSELTSQGERLRNGWWHITKILDTPAALDAATSYRVQVSGGADWRVMVVGGDDSHGAAGYDGTDAYVDWFGQTGARDAPIVLHQTPPALTGLDVEARGQTLSPVVEADCPGIEASPFARISWDASGVPGGSFSHYEVQRWDSTSGWQIIASIENQAITMVDDHEARIGMESTYRVRQVYRTGAPSPWAGSIGTSTVTMSIPDDQAGLWFTVNAKPGMNVAYIDLYDVDALRGWTFLDGSTTQLGTFYERDYQAAFIPIERRGVQFARRLLVSAVAAVRPSMRAFDALRTLSTEPVPAVCVRDHEGNRWWVHLDVTDGQMRQPGDLAYTSIMCTEIAGEPHPLAGSNVSLDAPWEMVLGRWGEAGGEIFVGESTSSGAIAAIDAGEPDGAIVASFTFGGSVDMGLAFRIVDAQNYCFVRSNGFGTMWVGTVIGGVTNEIASTSAPGGRPTVEFSGDSTTGGMAVTIHSNGVDRWTGTIASQTFDGATRHGLFWRSTNPTGLGQAWSDFEFYEPERGFGSPWEVGGGTWRIDQGSAYRWSNGGEQGRAVTVVDTGHADGQVVARLDAQNFTRVVFRYIDADNYLFLEGSRTFGGWTLRSRIAGVEAGLAQLALVPAGDNLDVVVQFSDDRVRVRLAGAWRTWDTGGQSWILTGDAYNLFSAATRHGIGQSGTTGDGLDLARWHRWEFRRVNNMAVSGAQVATHPGAAAWVGRAVDWLQLDGPVPADATVVFGWGINDAILVPPTVFREALRAVISRARAEAVISAEDGLLATTGTWNVVSGTDRNEGTGWLSTSEEDADMTVTFPPEFPGGVLVLAFIGRNPTDMGGSVTIGLDGDWVDTFTTEIWGGWTYNTPMVRRVHVPPGAHTVTAQAHGIAGTVDLDAVWMERSDPPRIAVLDVAKIILAPDFRPTSWSASTVTLTGAGWSVDEFVGLTLNVYDGPGSPTTRTIASNTSDTITVSGSALPALSQATRLHVNAPNIWGAITDGKVEEYNVEISALLAEFDNIYLVGMDAVLDKQPGLFAGDGLHPNAAGAAAVGAEVRRVLPSVPVQQVWIGGHSYMVGTSAGVAQGVDEQIIRRLAMPDSVSDEFDNSDDRGTVVEG